MESSKKMQTPHSVTPALCRAARGGLGLSQVELAKRAGVYRGVVTDFEGRARSPRQATRLALRLALEQAGIEFVVAPDGRLGVLLPDEDDFDPGV